MSGRERGKLERNLLGARLWRGARCDFAHVFMPTKRGGEWVLVELPPMDDDLRAPRAGRERTGDD